MSKRLKPWWIKERYNPQLGTYYVMMGQMSKTAATKHKRTRYGDNTMLRFDSFDDYQKKIMELKNDGKRFI